jgi:hypothetical protein
MDGEAREALRITVRHFYDIQQIRIQHSGRIARKSATNEAAISSEHQAMFSAQVKRLKASEADALLDVKEKLQSFELYRQVLSVDEDRWKGLGPTMSAVILAEVDIERCETPSALWRYAGLSTVPWKRCKQCNRLADLPFDVVDGDILIKQSMSKEYKHVRKKENEKGCDLIWLKENQLYDSGRSEFLVKGEKRHFNLFLKTKLLGVLAPGFLKAKNPVWRKVYDDYKNRLISAGRGTSPGHINNSAIRYMIKMFLLNLWMEWRTFARLPVRPSYHEEKLGHVHAVGV